MQSPAFNPSLFLPPLLAVLLLAPMWRSRPATGPCCARHAALPVEARPRPLTAAALAHLEMARIAAELAEGLEFPAVTPLRPLPVEISSLRHEWTAGDAFDPGVVQQIAHNADEFRRLIEEGGRILDRQLVYRREPVSVLVQRARAGGGTLERVVLPSLRGVELEVELTGLDLSPSGASGTLHGRLVGHDDSMVTLAFKGGREAFTVLSPTDDLYLQADPRQPGELVVKRIDPATYVVGVCGSE